MDALHLPKIVYMCINAHKTVYGRGKSANKSIWIIEAQNLPLKASFWDIFLNCTIKIAIKLVNMIRECPWGFCRLRASC